jgi:hypothetical protein
MKVSTENDNNFGYEKMTILVDNIPLNCRINQRNDIENHMLHHSNLCNKQ